MTTSVPSNMPFTYNNTSTNNKAFPVFPGAFMVNGTGSFPIFCSITNFSNYGMDNTDNSYIVMPGYKLELYYDSTYGRFKDTISNTDGTIILYKRLTDENNATSCKLYFNDTEIKVGVIS